MSTFSEQLKLCRTKMNTTQKELAKQIGLSERAYQHYESDTREPTLSNLIALADYFDVSLDYLVGRSDNPDSHKHA